MGLLLVELYLNLQNNFHLLEAAFVAIAICNVVN
jgi:hypothetical protein